MTQLEVLTDDELVNLYANGNNEAFDALLDRYKSKIYSYILYSVRSESVADDLFQETFIKVICSIQGGRYQATGKFASWVTRIARNLVLDHHRDKQSDPTVSNDAVDYDLLNDRDLCEPCHETELVNSQTLDDVRMLCSMLPLPQQEIVRMRMYEEMSFKEIAEKLDISISTALGRMRYALINLRKLALRNNVELAMLS